MPMPASEPMKQGVPVILVADDDREICSLLSLWFQDRFQLLLAFNGDDALTLAHRCSPDLAIIDVMLPRLSGLGLCWAIKHHPRLKTMPLAFMTAYHDAAKAIPDAEATLLKPFRKKALLEIIEAQRLKDRPPQPVAITRPNDRRTERFELALDCMLHRKDVSISGTLRSLSLLGAYFVSQEMLSKGTEWTLSFTASDRLFHLPASIVHCHDQMGRRGAGLSLHDLGLARERDLERLLESLKEDRSSESDPDK